MRGSILHYLSYLAITGKQCVQCPKDGIARQFGNPFCLLEMTNLASCLESIITTITIT